MTSSSALVLEVNAYQEILLLYVAAHPIVSFIGIESSDSYFTSWSNIVV